VLNTERVIHAGLRRRYLSVAAAEAETGVSRWTWRRMAYDGRVESTKVGTRLLIPASEVDRVISEGTRPRLSEVGSA
jgi:excisionase family DNA binding protein